jgi:hypothetical protein
MNEALAGRGRRIAAVGVVLGFIAIWLDYASAGGGSASYSDDGTILTFLLIALILSAVQLAAGKDVGAAAAGSAAAGFYLLIPASLGFDRFGYLDAGGWLGVCTLLIPLGIGYSRMYDRTPVKRPSLESAAPAILGRVLCLIAIWLTALDGSPSFWNLSSSGHALGLLMLVLVLGGAALGAMIAFGSATRPAADWLLMLAAVTFGLFSALLIGNAFGEFGHLDTGAWLAAAGSSVLLVGVHKVWKEATGGAR